MKFRYRAYLTNGAVDIGEVNARDRAEALKELVAAGKSVFDIEDAEVSVSPAFKPARSRSLFRFRRRQKPESLFVEMSVLMRAGMTVVQALAAIAEGEEPGPRRELLQEILAAVTSGKDAATAFSQAKVFRSDALSLIASGDAAGNLGEVFALLATEHEAREKHRARIREAIAYPVFLLFMMTGAVGLLTFVLVPAIEPIFDGSQAEMPAIVAALVVLRTTLTDWALPLAIGLAAITASVVVSPSFRKALAGLFFRVTGRIPLLGPIRRNLELARYLSSLSMLLRGGASMASALALSAKGCNDQAIRSRMEAVHDEVAHGQRLATAIRETGLFGPKVVSLVTAGDSVNRLPDVTASAASIIDAEARQRIGVLLALMTPAITILLGIMIGGLVLSIMSALLSINSAALP
ncbi:type II secretion system F family protein [Oricola cellulosilytica]|uniref:Type II secretion system F family protein n=1 Tax=Oricola cellulosilytica TaxID=1429082 RepID=A0A4R0PIW6_9HYPH|nr:type II secretion system F family protein [Oricola cellulosilytica]TCD16663.1 type II secretion system F family protein [Oricola cellulosilytica]